MKKTLKAILCVLMVLAMFALAACGGGASSPASSEASTPEATPESTPAAEEKFVFTVGFDQEFPPYGYVDDKGEFAGFDLDCAREVAARNGWEIKLQPIDWDAKDAELDSGAISCIWNGFTMNGREDLYTWSRAYMDNSQVLVVKADSGITDLAGLAGKIVTVQTDSSAQAALNDEESEAMVSLKASLAQIVVCAEYNTAFMDLEAGAVDAIAMDVGVAKFQMEGRESEFTVLSEALVAEQYGIGFKLGNTELCAKVQATFDEMMADGTIDKLAVQYDVADGLIK